MRTYKTPCTYIFHIAIASIIVFYFAYADYSYDLKKLKENIPSGFEIKNTVTVDYNIGSVYDCGLGVFELSDSVGGLINRESLIFLNKNIIPRTQDTPKKKKYKKWQEIPVNYNGPYLEQGVFPTWCRSQFASESYLHKLRIEIKKGNGFYTTGGTSGDYTMYIIPSLNVLAITVWTN